MIRVNRANLMRLKVAFGREPRTRWVVDTRSLWQSAGSWLMNFCLSTTRYISFFSLYDYSPPPPPFDAVIHVQESPPYKRFLVGCSSPFMRLAEHLTALRAWSVNTLRAPSLHYKEARVDGHTTTAMHDLNEYPPPAPPPSVCSYSLPWLILLPLYRLLLLVPSTLFCFVCFSLSSPLYSFSLLLVTQSNRWVT